jgi:predicted dehydrogenase
MRIGVIGCGNIFDKAYVPGAKKYDINLAVLADLDQELARSKANEHGIPRTCSVDELIADPDIDGILNLTIPGAHYDIDKRALVAGKHVYSEKPLAITEAEADELLQLAASQKCQLGCAPDTVLGAGIQTARRAVDEGRIGKVFGGIACLAAAGHESWHPSPAFYYQAGGGPAYDMGPYYLSALVTLLGPVQRVCAHASRHRTVRQIAKGPLAGQHIDVEIDTHLAGLLEFTGGVIIQVLFSFETWKHTLPRIQLFGTEASLNVPDPNGFAGPVSIMGGGKDEELTVDEDCGCRGLGLRDLIDAQKAGRRPRASGEMAAHVLAVICALHRGADAGWQTIDRPCERPEAMPE